MVLVVAEKVWLAEKKRGKDESGSFQERVEEEEKREAKGLKSKIPYVGVEVVSVVIDFY